MEKNDNNNDKEIRDLTQNAFKDFELQADDRVWVNVQNGLKEDERKIIFWWRYAAAASVAAIGLVFWFNMNQNPTPIYSEKSGLLLDENETTLYEVPNEKLEITDITTNVKESLKEEVKVAKVEELNVEHSTEANKIAAQKTSNNKVQPSSFIASQNSIDQEKLDEVDNSKQSDSIEKLDEPKVNSASFNQIANVSNPVIEQPIDSSDANETGVAEVAETATDTIPVIRPEDIDLGMPVEEEPTKKKDNYWFLAANIGSNSNSDEGVDNSGLVAADGRTFATNATPAENTYNDQSASNEERNYAPPIITSVTINYALNRRWSMETGLLYSLLVANSSPTAEVDPSYTRREELHYLGIPIIANYNFVNKKRFNAFVSAGISVNKAISYVNRIDNRDGDLLGKENSKVEGVTFNLTPGLGIEYFFAKRMSFYLLPSAVFYSASTPQPFSLGGSKTRGILPNARFGLRFHLNKNEENEKSKN